MEEQGQREEMLVNEVKTDIDNTYSKDKGGNNNNNRIFLSLSL